LKIPQFKQEANRRPGAGDGTQAFLEKGHTAT